MSALKFIKKIVKISIVSKIILGCCVAEVVSESIDNKKVTKVEVTKVERLKSEAEKLKKLLNEKNITKQKRIEYLNKLIILNNQLYDLEISRSNTIPKNK